MIKNTLYLSIVAILTSHSSIIFAQTNSTLPETTLDVLVVEVPTTQVQALPFAESQKASDMVIQKEKLQTKSATLGNALAGERGIHSNPFGGGASAPVIRGQDGVRVKILQNGTDVVDMSSVSPDHAVAVDSLLAEQIELVRGSSTLLYATASQAGVVNVIDKRIPATMPNKSHETEIFTRYNMNNDEKLATIGSTFALGTNFAMRVEGLARNANNYAVPSLVINTGDDPIKKLPDSYNRSKVGTLGLSWIGSKGYIGTSFSQRQDNYGLVGHNHEFDHCAPHILSENSEDYLLAYPHLMQDKDVSKGLHDMHCGNDHANNETHSHDNIYGHKHDYHEKGPWVDLTAKRYDIRGEWQNPIIGIDKLRLSSTYNKYYHDERGDGKTHLTDYEKQQMERGIIPSNVNQRLKSAEFYKNNPESIYQNKGLNTRLDIFHQPIGDMEKWGELKGSWGIQYQTQASHIKRPYHIVKIRDDISHIYGERQTTGREPLVENTNQQWSIFGVEQYRLKNFTLETGIRLEKQRTPIPYDMTRFDPYFNKSPARPDLSTYQDKAFSYSTGILWDFIPNYRLSLTASHHERLPTPMELYYHGKHLATNSYQYGNRDLKKEQSNNFEIGLMYQGDKWDYKFSTYYNDFKNFINNESLYRQGNLFQRRYTQYPAKIHGFEGEISYRFTPKQQITLYGDYVKSRLLDLPPIPIHYTEKVPVDYDENMCDPIWDDPDASEDDINACEDELERLQAQQPTIIHHQDQIPRPNRYMARTPPTRLGLTWSSQWNDNWSSSVDIMRVFPQNRTSTAIWLKEKASDDPTKVGKDIYHIYPIPEDKTAGYNMLNLGIDYHNRFNNVDYKISFNANNLLNEKVYIHNSYLPYVPQMGRNFSLALTTKF